MKKIVLRASGVASPRKVRYLHDGRQLGNIFSEVNLPLQPFEIEARPASDAGSLTASERKSSGSRR